LLRVITGEMKRSELQTVLGLTGRDNFRQLYLNPALDAGLIEMTIPEKPNSRLQRYRLTENGKHIMDSIQVED
jgi:ATP-dependent DNA helicase RecG